MILLQVDGDSSTNDTVIALASGLSSSSRISSVDCNEAMRLQACLEAVILATFSKVLCYSTKLLNISIILNLSCILIFFKQLCYSAKFLHILVVFSLFVSLTTLAWFVIVQNCGNLWIYLTKLLHGSWIWLKYSRELTMCYVCDFQNC